MDFGRVIIGIMWFVSGIFIFLITGNLFPILIDLMPDATHQAFMWAVYFALLVATGIIIPFYFVITGLTSTGIEG